MKDQAQLGHLLAERIWMIYETLLVPLLSTSQDIDTWASALCLNTKNHDCATINSMDNRK